MKKFLLTLLSVSETISTLKAKTLLDKIVSNTFKFVSYILKRNVVVEKYVKR